jgi:hypothetical protein
MNKEPQSLCSLSEMRFETTMFGGKREVLPVLTYHVMMMYTVVEVKLRVFLTSRTRFRRVVNFTLLPHCHRQK